MSDNIKSLIIVPTYNEVDNIEPFVRRIETTLKNTEILFVDDNSPDGTAQKIEEIRARSEVPIHLIVRGKKEGIGPAYIEGFRWAIQRRDLYDVVVECDADLSHDPSYIPVMISEIQNGYDVVVGSRYVDGGGIYKWDWLRKSLSRGASLYVNVVLGFGIKDPTSGFVAYKMESLVRFPLHKIKSHGYAFQIEMKYIAWKLGMKIKEIPIIFYDRKYGSSKMSLAIFHEALFNVMLMPFRKYVNEKDVPVGRT